MKAIKKKQSMQWYNKGKIGMLFIFGVAISFFGYFILSHVLPKMKQLHSSLNLKHMHQEEPPPQIQ